MSDTRYCAIDIKDFCLESILVDCEYMKLPIDVIPSEIVDLHNLKDLIYDGHICVEIQGGMHGLTQVGRIACNELAHDLKPFDYHPAEFTPEFWVHDTKEKIFKLIIDNFGI